MLKSEDGIFIYEDDKTMSESCEGCQPNSLLWCGMPSCNHNGMQKLLASRQLEATCPCQFARAISKSCNHRRRC